VNGQWTYPVFVKAKWSRKSVIWNSNSRPQFMQHFCADFQLLDIVSKIEDSHLYCDDLQKQKKIQFKVDKENFIKISKSDLEIKIIII